MTNWIVIEIDNNGNKRALSGVYTDWEDACEVQEAMEWLHDDMAYLIGKVIM